MNKNQPKFTTARLLTRTKMRVRRTYLSDGFIKLESAIDYYIRLGMKAHKQLKREKREATQ